MQSDTHLWNVLDVPQPVPDGPEKTAILGQKLQELFGGVASYIAECAVAVGKGQDVMAYTQLLTARIRQTLRSEMALFLFLTLQIPSSCLALV